jgi:hypothetical protein
LAFIFDIFGVWGISNQGIHAGFPSIIWQDYHHPRRLFDRGDHSHLSACEVAENSQGMSGYSCGE